jgi:hypothetical protein
MKMKNAELQNELERLAGPPPRATTAGLQAVHRRVRLARMRTWTLAGIALAIVVASVALVRGEGGSNPRVVTPAGPSTSVTSNPRVARQGYGQIPDRPVEACLSLYFGPESGLVDDGKFWVYDRAVQAPIQMDVRTYCEGMAAVQKATWVPGQPPGGIYVENGQVRGERP